MITFLGIIRKIKQSLNKRKTAFIKNLENAKVSDDYQLKLMALRYLAHQLEKVVKHEWSKSTQQRGNIKYEQALGILDSLKGSEYINSKDVIWSQNLVEKYLQWKTRSNTSFILPPKKYTQNKNSFEDIVQSRRSTRFWKTNTIPKEIIDEIISIGIMAPSSCNRQTWRFTVVKNINPNNPGKGISNPKIIEKAPYILYISIDLRMYSEKYAPAIDVGLTTQNILLAMESKNISACPIYLGEFYHQKKIRELINLGSYEYVYLALPFGYPDENPIEPARVSCDKVVQYMEMNTKELIVTKE